MHSVELAGRMLISLAVVLGAIWVIAKKFRGKSGRKRRQTKLIDVMGRQNLTRSSSVAVVRVAGEALIVGVTDQSVQTLGTIELDAVNAALVDGENAGSRQTGSKTGTPAYFGAVAPESGTGGSSAPESSQPRLPQSGSSQSGSSQSGSSQSGPSSVPSSPAALTGTLTAADIEAIRAARVTTDLPGQRNPRDPAPYNTAQYDAVPGHHALPTDTAATADTTMADTTTPIEYRDAGPLGGSALSPATWRQTLDALRDMTVRKG